MRKALIESPEADPHGFERILGESDLLSINFLDRGRRAADAVCRIKLPMDGGLAFGSGFLVGPRLLLTDNHVLATPARGSAVRGRVRISARPTMCRRCMKRRSSPG
jgi:endonuclease G